MEEKFSVADLITFVLSDDYQLSFADALDFVSAFLENQDVEFNDTQKEEIRHRWLEEHGH